MLPDCAIERLDSMAKSLSYSMDGKRAQREALRESKKLIKRTGQNHLNILPQGVIEVRGKAKSSPSMSTAYEIASKQIGVSEIRGKEHNQKILEYHSMTSLKATSDEVAWCSAFVCWVWEKMGIRSTNSAMAKSWLKWGQALGEPLLGCVVVFDRGPKKWMGHVGFYAGETKDYIKVLGGNQGNRVSIMDYPKKDLIAYRRPPRAK